MPAPISIQVQTVLFRNDVSDVVRLVTATGAEARYARREGLVDRVEVRIGDCSPVPVLDDDDIARLREVPGLDAVAYDFFAANLFTAAGHNRLAEGATTDYLLVQNPDTNGAPTLLAELARAVADPSVGMAEARQIPLEHPKEFDPFTGDTSWASTACVLIDRQAFVSLEGFDERHFPLYCDDVDFSWRLRLSGLRVLHVPRAVVFHDKRVDSEGRMAPTAMETYSGALARLMLCDRYGRTDVKDETVTWIEHHGSDDHRKALAEYRRLAAEGGTPDPVDDASTVAEFTDGEYASHRW
ncbi:MAG: glycosyltransferase family 2 protein [Acidimicrobiia bacterium]|nr:glycosyltransferase family 2 protein [Acidimicrobiia bacterium]